MEIFNPSRLHVQGLLGVAPLVAHPLARDDGVGNLLREREKEWEWAGGSVEFTPDCSTCNFGNWEGVLYFTQGGELERVAGFFLPPPEHELKLHL